MPKVTWTPLNDRDQLNTHGSAHLYRSVANFTDGTTVQDYFNAPTGLSGVILGRNYPYDRKLHKGFKGDPADAALMWNLTAQRGHGITFSTTGGGKNTNLITPALLGYCGSALVLDPKGENAWLTAERRRQMGHKVVILDPFDQVYHQYGSLVGVRETLGTFNPLGRIDPRSPDFAADIATVADGLITTPERGDVHWAESARELLGGMIAAVVERAPGWGTLGTVRAMLSVSDDEMSMMIRQIVETQPHSLAARKLRRFATGGKEITSIRSTALTQTAILDTVRLLKSMESGPDTLDLCELATRPTTVYVVLPADKLGTYGRWMRMIIQLAINAVGSVSPRPQIPVLFLLDELGTISPGAGLPALEKAVGLMGGLGVRVWSFFQDLSQVQRDYPTTWRTMIANSEIVQAIRLADPDTADYLSRHIGDQTVRMGSPLAGTPITYHSQPAMSSTSIRHLAQNDVLTVRSGGASFLLPTIPYFLDPGWAGKYRPDPNYAPPPAASLSAPPPRLGSPIAGVLGNLAAKDRELTDAAVKWAKGDGLTMAKGAAGMAARMWKAATDKPDGKP